MQQCSIDSQLNQCIDAVSFLVGAKSDLVNIKQAKVLEPFSDMVIDYLNNVSRCLMNNPEAKQYSDVISFAFWIRKSSVVQMRERFQCSGSDIKRGKGVVFHIAPSNVPVNYAYSLCTGLLTGNINIVRIPSKDFRQVELINDAFIQAMKNYGSMSRMIFLVRYEKNKAVNDYFSALANTRVIWGGDNTIMEIRKSPLQPRANEITFADRYSLAIIDGDMYVKNSDKDMLIKGFYDDTYRVDQNACTSPHFVIWLGDRVAEAQADFWERLHELVAMQYEYQAVMGVNKLTKAYLAAADGMKVRFEKQTDNLIHRVRLEELSRSVVDYRGNAGLFYEYECASVDDISSLCDDIGCQTIGYYGAREKIMALSLNYGVDRIVPIGHTMDFDLIWDGYNLYEQLTRTITINI